MPQKNFIWINIAVLLSLIAGKYFWDKTRPEDIKSETESLKIVYPEADSFSEKKGMPPHYEAYKINENAERVVDGLCILSTDFAPDVRGYAGKIKMMIGINRQGKITGIQILAHNETPSYVLEFQNAGWIAQFNKLDYKSSFEVGKDIDGITRATITSEAVAQALRKSVRLAAKNFFNLPVPDEGPFKWDKIYKNFNIYLVLLFFVLAIYLNGRGVSTIHPEDSDPEQILHSLKLIQDEPSGKQKIPRRLRYFILAGAIIYFGFWQINFISIIGLVNIFSGKIPSLTSNLPWYLLFVLSFLSAIFLGRIYCGWICPFGAIQEFLSKLKICVKINPDYDRKARYIKYYLLILIVAAVFWTGNIGYTNYEPFNAIFGFKGSILLWAFLAVLLLSSVFVYRFWCKYLCAAGAFFAIISSFSIYPIKAKNRCSLCERCESIC